MYGLKCASQSPQSFIIIYYFGSFSFNDATGLLFSVFMNRTDTNDDCKTKIFFYMCSTTSSAAVKKHFYSEMIKNVAEKYIRRRR